ncbi:hypothetical protein LTR17_027495 [Elasticomyces elasticus]|nr:hypothetical protein LTR17_027495 [Elasticomyces elasticus]
MTFDLMDDGRSESEASGDKLLWLCGVEGLRAGKQIRRCLNWESQAYYPYSRIALPVSVEEDTQVTSPLKDASLAPIAALHPLQDTKSSANMKFTATALIAVLAALAAASPLAMGELADIANKNCHWPKEYCWNPEYCSPSKHWKCKC